MNEGTSDTTPVGVNPKKKNNPPGRNNAGNNHKRSRRQPRNKTGNPSRNNNQSMSGKKLSHSLSWALRHAALTIGLTIREDGYVPVQEILDSRHPKLKGATLEKIQEVVETSDKQRFKLEERPKSLYYPNHGNKVDGNGSSIREEEQILCIRANQGHSISLINPELLLTRMDTNDLKSLPCIVHGTYPDAWDSIRIEGLKKMNRTHIHFASGLPSDNGVISGMRRNCGIYIFVDASKCAADNRIKFFKSDNGVILTDGIGDTGILTTEYFSHVTDSSGKILLDNRKQSANL